MHVGSGLLSREETTVHICKATHLHVVGDGLLQSLRPGPVVGSGVELLRSSEQNMYRVCPEMGISKNLNTLATMASL